MPHVSTVRTIDDLFGPAGRLEALLNSGLHDASYAALVCHPHPPSGGTMHNKVVYNAMKTFSHFGLPILRFNFRGTGLSAGTHDDGRGEVDDVRAALDYLHALTGKPILLAGFSFGANLAMRAGCGDPRVAGLVGLGLPVHAAGRDYTYTFLPGCTQPKAFISGDHDQFCPPDILAEMLRTAAPPWDSYTIAGAEHFFQGIPFSPRAKLDDMRRVLSDWLIQTFHLVRA